jgi:tRNA (mo5U34)-methyltransferase
MIEQEDQDVAALIASLPWYHSVDLGNGIVTPGQYDHRPYLHHYGIPNDLAGKTVIDIGAASGFFSFEFERRGAQVTATDLPEWNDHDFGPNYQLSQTLEAAHIYLHQPFEVARHILGSSVTRKQINIYDISPETVGTFDIAFCGSVLIHLTDPLKALWNIASVTNDKAIIATVVTPDQPELAQATMIGHVRGDAWWVPTRACLELMAVCAGFVGVEWISEFKLDNRDGSPGPYHGVLHAYKTTERWGSRVVHRNTLIAQQHTVKQNSQTLVDELAMIEQEIARLKALIKAYESGRFMRLMRWLHGFANRLSVDYG